jgi:hypothetical protein
MQATFILSFQGDTYPPPDAAGVSQEPPRVLHVATFIAQPGQPIFVTVLGLQEGEVVHVVSTAQGDQPWLSALPTDGLGAVSGPVLIGSARADAQGDAALSICLPERERQTRTMHAWALQCFDEHTEPKRTEDILALLMSCLEPALQEEDATWDDIWADRKVHTVRAES